MSLIHTPMLRGCIIIIAGTKEHFEGHTPPIISGGHGCDGVLSCRSTIHFFQLNHDIVGIARKLLSRARRFLRCAEAET